jgi:hypothetical protein
LFRQKFSQARFAGTLLRLVLAGRRHTHLFHAQTQKKYSPLRCCEIRPVAFSFAKQKLTGET